MSRSRRKSPFVSWTTTDSEKDYKQEYNRRMRRVNKTRLKQNKEVLLKKREVSDSYGPKDGKSYWGDALSKGDSEEQEMARKVLRK